jgi:hypothetical protein
MQKEQNRLISGVLSDDTGESGVAFVQIGEFDS